MTKYATYVCMNEYAHQYGNVCNAYMYVHLCVYCMFVCIHVLEYNV